MSKQRNQAAASAPPMEGQTAWQPGRAGFPIEPLPGIAVTDEQPIVYNPPASEGAAGNGFPGPDRVPSRGHPGPDIVPASNAGGRRKGPRKGPRKPRSPARTVVYIEKLFAPFSLIQRRAMHAMLSSVCEMKPDEAKLADGLVDAMRDQIGPARQP